MIGYKTILACLSDAETMTATLDVSFQVARAFGGHVEALHVRSDPTSAVPLVGEGMPGAMVEQMVSVAELRGMESSNKLMTQFEAECRKFAIRTGARRPGEAGASAIWREEVGREEEAVAHLGRLSDLVVLPRPSPQRDVPSLLTVNAALMETGRPVLLAPPAVLPEFGRRVVVLWNSSGEAATAVFSALPLLSHAEEVHIFSAREGEDLAPGELAGYLAGHGIQAKVRCVAASQQAGQSLLTEAGKVGADLIVMGAYTHSRLRQLLMGGVTRHMLNAATMPVMLSH